jgi:two-component system response regulator DesR
MAAMPRLVVVADNVGPVREAIKQALELELESGHRFGEVRVDTAEDGDSVIARCLEATPDLILMDVDMPGADGVDTFYRLKALDASLASRVVFLTGYAASQSFQGRLERALTDGASGVIHKPTGAEELRKVLERHLA